MTSRSRLLSGIAAGLVAAGAATTVWSIAGASPAPCPSAVAPVTVAVVDSGIQERVDLDGVVSPESVSLVPGEDLHDDAGHGTAMAALVHRAAPASPILVVKVLDERGRGAPAALADGIRLAADHGARVISVSTEVAGADPAVASAITHATGGGALVVVAAGNEGLDLDRHPSYPASFDDDALVVVAAADDRGRLTAGTNWGRMTVDLVAPGREVPVLGGAAGSTIVSGSSPAAAAVSGAAGRILALDGSLSATAVAEALRRGARTEPALEGRVRSGVLDVTSSTRNLGCRPL